MAIKPIFFVFFSVMSLGLYSQRPTLELTFTAVDDSAYVQLDSIKVINRTHGSDTVLYWPDTVLSIYYLGTPENFNLIKGFKVFQNYPNPVNDQTIIPIYVPEKDKVSLIVTDILGRVVLKSERVLDQGMNTFRFFPGNHRICFFTAYWRGNECTIKIINTRSNSIVINSLEYLGNVGINPKMKSAVNYQSLFFSPGDTLLCIGYANGLQAGILDSPEESTIHIYQFANNIPCSGTPTIEYDGQVYHTVQIFSQCWLKENLNVGEMIPASSEQSNNGIIEKYCYHNEPDSCTKYGGLYQWDEMMQYTIQPGVQGICPPGWHLPTDEEWKVLEGEVDSHYPVGDPIWDYHPSRGYDAGLNLKAASGWYDNGNGADLVGFSGLPGGDREYGGGIYYVELAGSWWTSSPDFNADFKAWKRGMEYNQQDIYRDPSDKIVGSSVRCIRDDQ